MSLFLLVFTRDLSALGLQMTILSPPATPAHHRAAKQALEILPTQPAHR